MPSISELAAVIATAWSTGAIMLVPVSFTRWSGNKAVLALTSRFLPIDLLGQLPGVPMSLLSGKNS